MTDKSISFDLEVPAAGQYSATVVAIKMVDQGGRAFAIVDYQLESEPPFVVPEFLTLLKESHGIDVVKGRARLQVLAVAAGIDLKSKITSTSDLQLLVGARVKVTTRLQEVDGIQIPKIVSVTAIPTEAADHETLSDP